MVGAKGKVREPDVSLHAVPSSISSLKGGGVSVVFHVPFGEADEALRVHKLKDALVAIDLYVIEDE